MTCPQCKLAGRETQLEEFGRAIALHEACEYPTTCTCQHEMTGVNWIQIKRDRQSKLVLEMML